MSGFEINLSKFANDLENALDVIGIGAREGMTQALDDWVRESRDIAPIDYGTLRRNIVSQGVEGVGLDLEGVITANAIEKSKNGRFNYAYYIHEVTERSVSGEAKFLEKPLAQNRDKYMRWIEEDIQDELKKAGW